jgi:hypothetical protein
VFLFFLENKGKEEMPCPPLAASPCFVAREKAETLLEKVEAIA